MDWPYFYAAAKLGAFDDLFSKADIGHLEEKDDIERALKGVFELTDLARGDVRVLIGRRKEKFVPVGLMISVEKGRLYEPHVSWFPWASSRNKLECWLRYLADRRYDGTYVIFTEFENKSFFERLAQYGVLRRVGNVEPNEGTPMPVWQTRIARR